MNTIMMSYCHSGRCLPRLQPLQIKVSVRTKRSLNRPESVTSVASGSQAVDPCDENIGDYCSIGPDGRPQKQTLGEKENIFLRDSAARVVGTQPMLTDAEFDLIEEELMWQGSDVITLTQHEHQLLCNFRGGAPMDQDVEAMATQLRREGSLHGMLGPRCSLDSRQTVGDAVVNMEHKDRMRTAAMVGILVGVLAADCATGAHYLNLLGDSSMSKVMAAVLLVPFAHQGSRAIVAMAGIDAIRFTGTCPACGTRGVEFSASDVSHEASMVSSCPSCSSELSMNTETLKVEVINQ